MSKYYQHIESSMTLSQKSGSAAIISSAFRNFSSLVIQQCSFLQSQIQQVIYKSHGPKLDQAKKMLRELPNPKGRFEYLCHFPYETEDDVVNRVFNYARTLFLSIYDIRNVLAHEEWHSSEEYPGSVLFSTLEENARLLAASGMVLHDDEASPRAIFDATIRYIRKIKVVEPRHLALAAADIDLCNWSLMNISFVLGEDKTERREEAKRAFYVYRGTSHLFEGKPSISEPVTYNARKSKSITEPPRTPE